MGGGAGVGGVGVRVFRRLLVGGKIVWIQAKTSCASGIICQYLNTSRTPILELLPFPVV